MMNTPSENREGEPGAGLGVPDSEPGLSAEAPRSPENPGPEMTPDPVGAEGSPARGDTLVVSPDDELPVVGAELHEQLGEYLLIHCLGKGGCALVYDAVDPDGASLALKVMQETPFVPAEMLKRFRREAEAVKKLRKHPSIVTVYDTGQVGRNHYIAMEAVPGGQTLDSLLKEAGAMSLKEALGMALPIAEALAYAHQNGIIHRDLKPANVLINEFGQPLLADFGLARIEVDDASQLTVSAMAMGTPRYMSPEQTSSMKKTDHLTDIYSFGVILYQMLTGNMPYEVDSTEGLVDVFRAICYTPPRIDRELRRRLSRDVLAVLLKLLEKNPL